MNEAELLEIVRRGEDSRHQFKSSETNPDAIAAELTAFANSGGGRLFLGVADLGRVTGLDVSDVRRLNQLLSNVASQNVRPLHSSDDGEYPDGAGHRDCRHRARRSQ